MSIFDSFDYPRAVTKVDVTEGYTNQSTGEWVPETTSETSISGHVADVTLKERQYLDDSVVERGTRKLSCDSSISLAVGDRVKITEYDGTVTEWNVNAWPFESGLIEKYTGISRSTFLLIRK